MSDNIQTGDALGIFGDRFRPRDILPMLRRGWLLILVSVVACFVVAVLISVFSTREYRATAMLRVVPGQAQEVQSREILDMNPRGFQEVERFYRTQVQLFHSRSFAQQVADAYEKQIGESISAGRILGGLQVSPVERSQLMQVSFVDDDPERAADVANLVARTFVARNIAWRRDMAREANDWVDSRIAEVSKQREQAVADLLTFKREHGIVGLEEVGGAPATRLGALEESFGAISTERVLLESRLDNHKALLRRGDITALVAQEDLPISSGLRDVHAQSQAELATVSARYGVRHPEYARVSAALERIEERVRAAAAEAVRAEQARLELLKEQEARLDQERSSASDAVLTRQELAAEFRELQRHLDQVESTEARLLERQQELRLAAESQLNNVSLEDEALPPGSFIRPRISLVLAAGFAFGALLGMALALLRGILDETIYSPADVESFIRLPLLGVVPHSLVARERPELLVHEHPRSSVAEAIRGVRTMVETGADGSRNRRILVTSAIASEGKTSVAVQLGTVFAQHGRRTLLIEGDHRRPRLHSVFGMANADGLNELLLEEVEMDQAIRPTEVPSLFVLPRGRSTPDSVERLGTEVMAGLLERLEEEFDCVVIDTPPSATLSDAVYLSRFVDAVVLVVRAGRASRSVVRHTLGRLEQVGAAVAGLVVNDVKSSAFGSRYGYGYYYNSNYYYEPTPDDESEEGEAAK